MNPNLDKLQTCPFEKLRDRYAGTTAPNAGFYFWAPVASTGLSGTAFTRKLRRQYNATVLPGSFLQITLNHY